MIAKIKFLVLSIFVIFLGCSNCDEVSFQEKHAELLEFQVKALMDQDELFIITLSDLTEKETQKIGPFYVNSKYSLKTTPNLYGEINYNFYTNLLLNNEEIFDKKKGEVFQVNAVIGSQIPSSVALYSDLQYVNGVNGYKYWEPEHVTGSISVIEEDQVFFDLIFSKGIESRYLKTKYKFYKTKESRKSCPVE